MMCLAKRRWLLRVKAALLAAALLAAPAWAGPPWSIAWWSIDGGSQQDSSGGTWGLSGSLGQWDATSSAAAQGGQWALTGGFWALPMDRNEDTDRIFSSRFE
ncbi:MAG: hypothetical protein AAGJ52_11660 [Pseudomonadota bacterium]